jgi:hypothetical protein
MPEIHTLMAKINITSNTTTSTLNVDDSVYTICECPPTPREPIPVLENTGPYANAITFHDKMIWGSKNRGGKKKEGRSTAGN